MTKRTFESEFPPLRPPVARHCDTACCWLALSGWCADTSLGAHDYDAAPLDNP